MLLPTHSRLLLPILPLMLLIGACGDRSRPNVLIITVDTLRADYLGAYGDVSGLTPNIDAFARDATLFENAAAPMPMTRPSHFSMLTSKYPHEHGVLNNATALPESAVSLAETLQASGYSTAAVVGVSLLSLKSGTSQGFDLYNRPRVQRDRPAEVVVPRALKWLENLPEDAAFFLWVHLFDPHMPYEPPKEFRLAAAGDLTAISGDLLRQISEENGGDIPASVLERSKVLYRGEIAYVDHWIGKLLSGVEERSDPADTIAVLTADHGECFGNGVYFDHAHCLSEAALRIPLMVRFPPQFQPGERVSAQTSIIDIMPTILEAVGSRHELDLSGRPLQQALEFGDRAVLLQHPLYTPEQMERYSSFDLAFDSVAGEAAIERRPDLRVFGLAQGDWKYLRSPDSETLTHNAASSGSETNMADEFPAVRRRLSNELEELLQLHPPHSLPPAAVHEDLKETLRALGYID